MTRLDRRALFASGAAAALLSASGMSLSAAPRCGGRLRLAVPRDGSLEAAMRGALCETLCEVAPDGVLRGELASAWQGSEDARVWRFDLRAGQRFHDGREVGAEDVVASLAAHGLAERVGLRALEATAPLQVRMELREGDTDLPYRLADPTLFVAAGGAVGATWSELTVSGTYRVADVREGRRFRGERVAGHHREGRAGWVESVEIVVIPDAGVRAEALRDGFVDVAHLPRPEGLIGRGAFRYHPSAERMVLAAAPGVGVPGAIGAGALDGGRIVERWWMA